MGQESRKHTRVGSRLRCWCEGDNVTVYAQIGNLSEGGLFLRTSTPMPKGAKAVVRLKGDSEEVSAPVRVVWTRDVRGSQPPGMGLEFGELDDRVREAIRRIIKSERHGSKG
jgi:uncharacterized protein (TIGR02266 family)